jgi:FkbM family methyltransferase
MLRDGPYEPQLRSAMAALVSPGSLCADVGAHHGLVTIFLADIVGPDGRVVAFEAHPENADVLRDAVEAAGMADRVTIENIAVTEGGAPRVLLHPGRGEASAEWNVVGADVDGRATPALLEVDAISLDAFFPQGEPQPDLVKVDVEGAEAQVLAGMRRLLREARPAIALEFHNNEGWAGRRQLFNADYDLYTAAGHHLDPELSIERVYHCVALPRERTFPSRLAP